MATEADEKGIKADKVTRGDTPPLYEGDVSVEGEIQTERYEYEDSRKLGIVGSAFIILNKMIGTGSEFARPLLGWLYHR